LLDITTYYRGRIPLPDLIQMPIGDIHTIEYIIFINKDHEMKEKEAEGLEDAVEEMV